MHAMIIFALKALVVVAVFCLKKHEHFSLADNSLRGSTTTIAQDEQMPAASVHRLRHRERPLASSIEMIEQEVDAVQRKSSPRSLRRLQANSNSWAADNPSRPKFPANELLDGVSNEGFAAEANNPTSQPTSSPTGSPTSSPTWNMAFPTPVPSPWSWKRRNTRPPFTPNGAGLADANSDAPTEPSDGGVLAPKPKPEPTSRPSAKPSSQPTSQPTAKPSSQPTSQPTSKPSSQPTSQPTSKPSSQPTSQPTAGPSSQPTLTPSTQPTSMPSSQPSAMPSSEPTSQPSSQPSVQPTSKPSARPSFNAWKWRREPHRPSKAPSWMYLEENDFQDFASTSHPASAFAPPEDDDDRFNDMFFNNRR